MPVASTKLATFCVAALTTLPLVTQAQASAGRRFSFAVAGSVHAGQFGGQDTNGFGVSGLAWLRLASMVALRGDVSYALKQSDDAICVFDDPCPQMGLSELMGVGVSAKVGNLLAPSTRPYLLVGTEWLITQGEPDWDGRSVVLPKLGLGALFPTIFVELSGRWRDDWDGWRVRHFVLQVGRYW